MKQTQIAPEMSLDELIEVLTQSSDDWEVESRATTDGKEYAVLSTDWGNQISVSPSNFGCTVIVGQLKWAKGADLAEAKKMFRRQGGRFGEFHAIFTFDPGTMFTGVTGMGGVGWIGEYPEVTEVDPEPRSRR